MEYPLTKSTLSIVGGTILASIGATLTAMGIYYESCLRATTFYKGSVSPEFFMTAHNTPIWDIVLAMCCCTAIGMVMGMFGFTFIMKGLLWMMRSIMK